MIIDALIHRYTLPFSHQLALDDCIALRSVMSCAAERLSVNVIDLHRRFAVALDEEASKTQILALAAG